MDDASVGNRRLLSKVVNRVRTEATCAIASPVVTDDLDQTAFLTSIADIGRLASDLVRRRRASSSTRRRFVPERRWFRRECDSFARVSRWRFQLALPWKPGVRRPAPRAGRSVSSRDAYVHRVLSRDDAGSSEPTEAQTAWTEPRVHLRREGDIARLQQRRSVALATFDVGRAALQSGDRERARTALREGDRTGPGSGGWPLSHWCDRARGRPFRRGAALPRVSRAP